MIQLLEEPTGSAYKALLTLAMERCDTCLFVKRDQLPLEQSGYTFVEQLQPYLKDVKRLQQWPGTRLLGHFAEVYEVRCAQQLVELLTSATKGLYGWLQPRLLEDLCFMRDGQEWLVTVSHEQIGYIHHFDEQDVQRLREIPDLMFY